MIWEKMRPNRGISIARVIAGLAAVTLSLIPSSLRSAPIATTQTVRTPARTTAVSCSGVSIFPGMDLQRTINAHPEGTTFCIRKGLHLPLQPVVPKRDIRLIGEPGAILSGSRIVTNGIQGWRSGATGVVVSGLIVQDFVEDGIQAINGWVVENNEIRYNRGSGLRIAEVTRNNFIHHNGRYGISGGAGTRNYLVEANEIAFNNTRNLDWWDAGGTKFIRSEGLTLRGNYVHDNNGHGLWLDGNNRFALYEGNRLEDNAGAGIFHEISYDAVIRNNTFKSNGTENSYWANQANLLVHSSPNVEVVGNTMRGLGISLVHSPRGSGDHGPYELRNAYVHDNTVDATAGHTGMVHYGTTDTSVYTSWNNRFEGNDYNVRQPSAAYWQWNGAKTWSQWLAYGHDETGRFSSP